ncbi:HutD family protein [Dongia soli]|uniref:HutD family protein n=1 Tax=Dongia soli TaxID=600628 RepID=A0ABU5E4Q6_9PROT|nr:HutD family protein [Dongia soli]MDY0881235.1 HutD family protein [Dongia soli]
MQITSLPFANYRRVPWRNGGGQAMDIAVEPAVAGSADDFTWRVALAEIDRDGPFSVYGKGVERIITLLDGEGFDLDITGGPGIVVHERHMPARFSGDKPTTCRLRNGRCIVFNVMHDVRYSAQLNIITPLPNHPLIFSPPGRTTVLFCLLGSFDIKFEDDGHSLKPWDSLRLDLATGEAPLLTLTSLAADSRLLLVGFEPAEEAASHAG